MSLIQPNFLKKGDCIGIAATARKVSVSELSYAIQYLQERGYNIILSSNIYSAYHQFAGNDIERAKGLQELLDHPDVRAIFIARGGYGTVRIIDKIDFVAFTKHPKWVCGFSDVTALHSHIFNLGFKSIHSTMPLLFSQSTKSVECLFDVLEGKEMDYCVLGNALNRVGVATGILVGGNLSVLCSISGSVSQIDYRDKILFIEDVDEYLYHIDRMMMQLKRAGTLKHLRGLIVGGMTDMKDNEVPYGKTAEEIIRDMVNEYDYPVCFGFPAGHIKDNMALIHGEKVELNISPNDGIVRLKSVERV